MFPCWAAAATAAGVAATGEGGMGTPDDGGDVGEGTAATPAEAGGVEDEEGATPAEVGA